MENELLIGAILIVAFLFCTSALFRWRIKTYITAMAVIAVITMIYFETGADTQLPQSWTQRDGALLLPLGPRFP